VDPDYATGNTDSRPVAGVPAVCGCSRIAYWYASRRAALRWKDFDESAGVLIIERAVYDKVFDSPKTEKSCRLVPLSEPALAFLLEWRRLSKRTAPDDFIFSGRKGGMRDQA
jgi:integrase